MYASAHKLHVHKASEDQCFSRQTLQQYQQIALQVRNMMAATMTDKFCRRNSSLKALKVVYNCRIS